MPNVQLRVSDSVCTRDIAVQNAKVENCKRSENSVVP